VTVTVLTPSSYCALLNVSYIIFIHHFIK
jgi:hypothetical protein